MSAWGFVPMHTLLICRVYCKKIGNDKIKFQKYEPIFACMFTLFVRLYKIRYGKKKKLQHFFDCPAVLTK